MEKEPPFSLKSEGGIHVRERVPHTYQIKEKTNSTPLIDSTDRNQLLKEEWAL